MRIYNLSAKAAIDENAEAMDTAYKRALGLMFRAVCNNTLLFVFDRKGIYSIHSFFVFFLFDAVYIDENRKVVQIIRNIKPCSFITPKYEALYLLELPKKLADNARISVGDQLEFQHRFKKVKG